MLDIKCEMVQAISKHALPPAAESTPVVLCETATAHSLMLKVCS